MFIKKITLKNYRCYAEQTFDLAGSNDRNVVLINGPNGAGKSSLFNAIGWCIFGEETQEVLKTRDFSEDEKFIPHEGSYDEDGMARVEVEIVLEFPKDSPIYQAVVSRKGIYKSERREPVKNTTVSIAAYDRYNRSVDIDEQYFIDNVIPKQLASFYLLDSEWLKKYGKDTNIKVSNGIEKLFRLDRFSDYSIILQDLSEKYKSKWVTITRKSGRNKELSDTLNRLYREKSELVRLLKEKQLERDSLEEERAKTEDQAKGISEIAELFEKYKEQERTMESAKSNMSKFEREYLNQKLSMAYLINSRDLLKTVFDKIKKEEREATIKLPPDVAPTFVNTLLKNEMCICGRKIVEGSHEHDLINSLLLESTKAEANSYLTDLTYKIENSLRIEGELEEKLGKISKQIDKEVEDYRKAESEIKKIKESAPKEIGGMEDLSKQYRTLIDKLSTYSRELSRVDEFIIRKKDEIKRMDNEIEQKESKLKKDDDLSTEEERMLFRSNLSSVLKESCEFFAMSAKMEFARLLQEGLNSLLKESPGFEHFEVEIEPLGNGKFLRVHYKEVDSKRFYLSGGQAEFMGIVLMVSFIKLLERFGEQSLTLPFIMMDNPFHDLSQANIKRVYENISSFFAGTQVIVFMPDMTFEGIKDYSHNGLLKVFTLKNNRETKTTEKEMLEGEAL